MSALIALLLALLSAISSPVAVTGHGTGERLSSEPVAPSDSPLAARVVVVANGEPTGPLSRGDILIEHHVPSLATCDQRGGVSVTVDDVIWCFGEDF